MTTAFARRLATALLFTLPLFAAPGHAQMPPVLLDAPDAGCDSAGRDAALCARMRHLRRQLNLLDTQRELMEVDFAYTAAVADDMAATMQKMLTSRLPSAHIEPLSRLRSRVLGVADFARMPDVRALCEANELKQGCLSCHSEQEPRSGRRWSELSGLDWLRLNARCSREGSVPYVCRSMYGMLTQIDYLRSADQLGAVNFGAIGAAAGEIERIATALQKLGAIPHADILPLDPVVESAAKIRVLAKRRDAGALERTAALVQSCARCHEGPEL